MTDACARCAYLELLVDRLRRQRNQALELLRAFGPERDASIVALTRAVDALEAETDGRDRPVG